jgi:hypothetical protein
MKRTFWYAAMTKDEAQHSRMTFYEAVLFYPEINTFNLAIRSIARVIEKFTFFPA